VGLRLTREGVMSFEARTGILAAFHVAEGNLGFSNSGALVSKICLRSLVLPFELLGAVANLRPAFSWLAFKEARDFLPNCLRVLIRQFQRRRTLAWNVRVKADPINIRSSVTELLRAAGYAGGCSFLAACAGNSPAASEQVPGNPPSAGANMSESATMPSGPATAAPARDGNIAIQEEFDAAVNQNSIDALELFVLRHPDHPLAEDARQRIAALKGGAKGK
jgi:hypothetical protein